MKIPNKRELQQIVHNCSWDIHFLDLYKKRTAEPHSFLVIDDTFASVSPSLFRENPLERI